MAQNEPKPGLCLYVIYRNPSDYPGLYVVRRHCLRADAYGAVPEPHPLIVTTDLDSARNALPAGLYNLGRHIKDDPVILEVWI